MVESTKKTIQESSMLQGKTAEDFECPICCNFCAEPIMTPCKHQFCLECSKQEAKAGMACPLCRKHFDKAFVPVVEFEERKDKLVKAKQQRGNQIPIRFAFGNLYKTLENPKADCDDESINCKHWFQMFVCLNNDAEATQKFISKVVYQLHPRYEQRRVTITEAPFLLARTAYGPFYVKIVIHFQEWTGLRKHTLKHDLVYNENGKTTCIDIDVEDQPIVEEIKAPEQAKQVKVAPSKAKISNTKRGFGSSVSRIATTVKKQQPEAGQVKISDTKSGFGSSVSRTTTTVKKQQPDAGQVKISGTFFYPKSVAESLGSALNDLTNKE